MRFHPKFHSHLKSKAVRTALLKMEQAKISQNSKNQNYLNKIVVKDIIKEEMRNDLKVKRRRLDQKLKKRLGKGKNNDVADWEKNAMACKKFLVKKFLILKKV